MSTRVECRHCGYWIAREGGGPWVHVSSGMVLCFADTDAEPTQP